jgi:hypothetical protein
MWTDYYLKTTSQAELETALPAAWLATPYGKDYALDVPGTLYSSLTGHPIPGYHANLRLREGTSLPELLAPFSIAEPAFPKLVFAE